MGAEGFLLIVAAVVYGYTATMLIFGTAHCLGIIFGRSHTHRAKRMRAARCLQAATAQARAAGLLMCCCCCWLCLPGCRHHHQGRADGPAPVAQPTLLPGRQEPIEPCAQLAAALLRTHLLQALADAAAAAAAPSAARVAAAASRRGGRQQRQQQCECTTACTTAG